MASHSHAMDVRLSGCAWCMNTASTMTSPAAVKDDEGTGPNVMRVRAALTRASTDVGDVTVVIECFCFYSFRSLFSPSTQRRSVRKSRSEAFRRRGFPEGPGCG